MPEPNVLVVEDDDTIRRLLVEYLRSHVRIQVESARDGVEALHLISTRPWRVVLLDVMMPKMSGVDLLDSLHALLSDPSVKALDAPPPVLVITGQPPTALSDSLIRRRSPEMVREVFRKPLDIAALAESVKKHLRYDPPRR